MKTRDIVKLFVWRNGFQRAIVAGDGLTYHELKKNFTANQLDKLEDARQTLKDSFAKKWGIDKADLKDQPRGD